MIMYENYQYGNYRAGYAACAGEIVGKEAP